MSLPRSRGISDHTSLRFLSQAIMGAGAILAAAACAGPDWLIRVGVFEAVVAGTTAVILLSRAIVRAAKQHAEEMDAQRKTAAEAMRAERKRERDVLETIDERTVALQERIKSLRQQLILAEYDLEEKCRELASAEGRIDFASSALIENEALISKQEGLISELRSTVQHYEMELAGLREAQEEHEAELLALPRRVDRSAPEISEAM